MNRRLPGRYATALVAGVALAASLATVATATTEPPVGSEAATGEPLRVMLTNDDGWNAGGLPSLREALVAAGFDVIVFAPADDQSGNSGRLTFGQPLAITQETEGVFSVAGSPADSAEAGLSLAFPGEAPDVVISGPNPGANIANASIHSGTIGAAVTAANEGVPAIAVSTNGDPAGGEVDYTVTNAFVIELVNALAANAADGSLLPDGLALNVNVPFVAAGEEPAGVAITTTDRSYIDLDYSAVELPGVGESVDATAEFVLTPTVDPASDAGAIDGGLIAITLVEGNYDAAAADTTAAELEALTPLLMSLG